MSFRPALLCFLCAVTGFAADLPQRGKADHVVLIVWDGMRADFVKEEYAPNLTKLASGGVRFRNHHSVYPSLTNVNATALATGVYPARSGMIANWAFRPELSGGKLARTDAPEIIRKGDATHEGHYLSATTIAELVRARGGRAAIAGTKTASLLHNRNQPARDATHSVTLFAGETLPESALAPLVDSLGKFPEEETPNSTQDAWTTRALTEVLWRDGVPKFSLLWMSDPDKSQHASSPGSKDSLGGIKSADDNLGRVLRALDSKGVLDKTDVIVASDHGFSTIERRIDVAELLQKKGFNVADEKDSTLARAEVRVAGNGGMALFYVGEHDRPTAERVVEVLQQTDFASVILTREPTPGTFPMSLVHVDVDPGPDVLMSFRWSDHANSSGTRGMIDANAGTDPNKATHGTFSPFDLHNTFVATGPDFRHGIQDELPTSNVDVAATIMNILGLTAPQPLDGRVVSEAMTGSGAPQPKVEHQPIEASRDFANGTWRQRLDISKLGASLYINEGRGAFDAK
ncbi:MAG: alkaline phosphatase family protein [Chthoniobacterales bacterium]